MKRHALVSIIGIMGLLTLAACGGGGGGGGGGVQKQTTKLYLFGNLSTNFKVANVTTTLTVPNFTDYSASASDANGVSSLRSGVITASGPALASQVSGTYNVNSKLLTIALVNGGNLNMTSSTVDNAGKGTEIATLVTTAGTTLPTTDPAPAVGQFRLVPPKVSDLNGCLVNFAP